MKRRQALALVPAAGLFFTTARRSAAAPSAEVARDVLPNGLVVLVEERRTADTVALQLAARAGTRDDDGLPGIEAITTRMLAQGTPRRPSESDVQRTVAQVGGTFTYGTGAELTSFASNLPSDAASLGLNLLADLVTNPLLSESALAGQKQITLQNLAQRRADPSTVLADLFRAEMFAGHPISTPPLGTPQSVQAITGEAVRAAWLRSWGATNLALAVVGRIKTANALAMARDYFSALPAGVPMQRPPAQPRPITSPRVVFAEAGQQQAQFRLGMAAPPVATPDYYPLVVLNAILSGELFAELRTVRGLAYVAGSAYQAYTDAGAWYAAAGVDPENLPSALAVTQAVIEDTREAPPGAQTLAGASRYFTGRQALAEESNAARASLRVSQELLGTNSLEEFVRRIREVTPDDMFRVAQTYLDLDHSLLAVVGPQSAAPQVPLTPPAAPAVVGPGK